MSIISQKPAKKGSQYWIQKLVNERPEILSDRIGQAIKKSNDPIRWVSPLKEMEYVEYSDDDFISILELEPEQVRLNEFWPKRGPNWDGLGISESGNRFLIEAKSHIQEMVSPPSGASDQSLEFIDESLGKVKDLCHVKNNIIWSGYFYQYFNRLAHLKYLRFDRSVEAYLVFLYFAKDTTMKHPANEDEWKGAIELFHSYAGIKRTLLSQYIVDVFIDVSEI
jgi:hypothetical protein